MGDTTDWKILEESLKLVALQDPGNRLNRLFEDYGVFTQERSQEIIEVVSNHASTRPGLQLITDQGSPYMAEAARQAYENLECDHVPQKESTPTAKATLERAFRSVKEALEPFVSMTNRLAERVPLLKSPELARPLGQLLIALFLKVYLMAAKDSRHPLEGCSREHLEIIAQEQREKSRQEDHSKRLLLTQIHEAYVMAGSKEQFVRVHRRHALEDIQEAERRLRAKACRCIAKACDRYFAAILRNVAEEGKTRRRREREAQLKRHELKKQWVAVAEERRRQTENPELFYYEGLDYLALQWLPEQKTFFSGGHGPGRGMMKRATQLLSDRNPWAYQDQIQSLWKSWKNENRNLDPLQIQAVEEMVQEIVKRDGKHPSLNDTISHIVKGKLPNNQHSPPHKILRI
jgi:hypothetical protein